MSSLAINNALSLNNGIPGVFIGLDLTGAGAAADNTLRRALIVATRQSSGTAGADTPALYTDVSGVNAAFGQRSDAARMFRAMQSAVGTGALDISIVGVNEPSGGVASRYDMVGSFSTGSSAASADSIDIWFCGDRISVGIAAGDTLATIMGNIKTAFDLLPNVPATSTTLQTSVVTSDTLRMTYVHRGGQGEDFPIRCHIATGNSNFRLSPGYDTAATLVFATNATSDGNVIVNCGATTITTAILSGDTPTVIAGKVNTAISAGAYPVTAANPSGANVNLYFAADRDVRRVTAKVVKSDGTANGTTVNAVAAGSLAYVGTATSSTPGSGTPTLTTALTNIAAQRAFGAWATCFNDSTSLGTILTHIKAYSDGYNQKDQTLHFGSVAALATAGAIPAATSPALTSSVYPMMGWCPDNGQQACEDAARSAAVYLAQNYVAQNMDGTALLSRSTNVPRLLPHVNSRSIQDDQNAAMKTYYMTPLVVDGNSNLSILRGVTTSNNADPNQSEWSFVRQLAFGRIALRQRLTQLFSGKNFKANSTPKTPNCFTTQSVKNAIFELLQQLDDQDLFDGAVAVKDAIECRQNGSVPTRLDIFVPWAVIRPIHQLSAMVSPQ